MHAGSTAGMPARSLLAEWGAGINRGAKKAKRLDHADIDTTANVYSQVALALQR